MENNLDILNKEPRSPMEKAENLLILEGYAKRIKERIDKYKSDLLITTTELDVLQLKTGKYTISRCRRITPKVVDFEALKVALDEAKIPYETKETFADFMGLVFKKCAEEHRELNGLEVSETEYIMVRIAKEKENHE